MPSCRLQTIFNIPNTIGHIRILLLYVSIFTCNITFILCYTFSAALDALDGKMARKYNQSTFLGSCLDMITDRVSTILIFMKIMTLDQRLYKFLTFTLLTDILSHFLYFSYSISNATHHKQPQNYFLQIYYKKNVLLILCTGAELFFITLFLSTIMQIPDFILYFLGIFSVIKTFFHVVQLYVGVCRLSLHEEKTTKQQ